MVSAKPGKVWEGIDPPPPPPPPLVNGNRVNIIL